MCLESSSILTCSYSSASQRLSPQSSQDAQLLFCAPLAGKSISVQIILATSPVYSLLKTEPLYVEHSGSLVAQSHNVKGVGFPQRWRITLSYLHSDLTGCRQTLQRRNEIREKYMVTVLGPVKLRRLTNQQQKNPLQHQYIDQYVTFPSYSSYCCRCSQLKVVWSDNLATWSC